MPEQALVTEPTALVAVLASFVALVFALSRLPALSGFFDRLPPVIWCYFLPMLATTFGIIPSGSTAYDWMSRYLLPMALFLMMLTIDLPAIGRLGPKALIMMLVGTVGVVLGGPLAYMLFDGLIADPEAWKGFAALSGSWIGGTANMLAIGESVGVSDSTLAPLIVVDTVVGYGWMALLLLFSAYQTRFDAWVGADRRMLEETNAALESIDKEKNAVGTPAILVLVGIGLAASVPSRTWGDMLPALGDPTIVSTGTWAVLIAVTAGLLLSFTPARRLERDGASAVGYAALYLLLASIGASADLRAVLQTPVYLLAGVVWISFHALLLLLAAKLLRAPLFYVATGSMANIGGAASAPIVAGVYLPAMAPVGLLMAIAGYVLGIYFGLVCAWLLSMLA
jgi:uncharacterized membrane protein